MPARSMSRPVLMALGLAACSAAPATTTTTSAALTAAITLAPGDVAITDVAVVPMTGDAVLEHQTVVVRGDRIIAVAPSATVSAESGATVGATVIDGRGKWLLPGLADMHVHVWSESQLVMFIAAGVTTVRNMYGGPMHLAWRSKIARGELFGPTLVTAGPVIDGDPPVWPGSEVLASPAAADRLVAEQKARGYDFLKPYARLSREAYEALVAAGKKHGMPLAGHVPDAVGLTGVLAARQMSIEHLGGWLAAMVPDGVTLPAQHRTRAMIPLLDAARMPALVAQTVASGVWNCPTLIVYARMGALEDTVALARRTRWLDKMPPAVIAQWDPGRDFRFKTFTAEDFAAIRAANGWYARIVAALAAAGAPLIVGTDTGNPYVVPGESMHDEIELMVAAGMPRPQVMRAATAGAGAFLGTPHEVGIVAVGARADLLLVPVNPLTGPLPLVPDGVMVRGTWHPRAALEARLAEVAKASAAPLPDDLWHDVPALSPIGTDVRQATYRLERGKRFGEERVAIGVLGPGKRGVVAQIAADFGGGPVQIHYTVLPDETAVAGKAPYGGFELTGKLAAGKLVVTGTDGMGKPVSLEARVPAGAFLSSPSAGGSLLIADRLARLKVGEKRTLTAIEISYFPTAAIVTVTHEAVRKPDVEGRRVLAITTRRGNDTATGELVLDADGVVEDQLAPPFNARLVRLPAP